MADDWHLVPIDDLPTAVVNADGENLLSAVIDMAAEQLGITVDASAVEFMKDPSMFQASNVADYIVGVDLRKFEETSFAPRRNFDVVRNEGLIWWGVPLREVTVRELVAAAELGLVDGDPAELIFAPFPPAGGGFIGHIELYLAAAPGVLAAVTQIRDSFDDLHWFRELASRTVAILRRGNAVLESHRNELESRSATPGRIDNLLDNGLSVSAVASMLGMTDDETESLLASWGYVVDAQRVMHLGTSREATLMRALFLLTAHDPVDLVGQSPSYELPENDEEERRFILLQAILEAGDSAPIVLPNSESFRRWEPPA